jgi:hypothetical protein
MFAHIAAVKNASNKPVSIISISKNCLETSRLANLLFTWASATNVADAFVADIHCKLQRQPEQQLAKSGPMLKRSWLI